MDDADGASASRNTIASSNEKAWVPIFRLGLLMLWLMKALDKPCSNPQRHGVHVCGRELVLAQKGWGGRQGGEGGRERLLTC